MSRAHDIDNASPLFDFDSHEPFEPLSLLEEPARRTGTPSISTLSRISQPAFHLDDVPSFKGMDNPVSPALKGKKAVLSSASLPMAIPLGEDVQSEPDLFSLSFASGSSSTSRYDPLSPYVFHASQPDVCGDVDSIIEVPADHALEQPARGKGKSRELPPTLPPLSFSPPQFAYDGGEWSSLAGPSSYGSSNSSMGESNPGSPSGAGRTSDSAPNTPALPQHPPASGAPRRRTLSSVSKHSLRSLSTPSLPKMKVKFAGPKAAPGTLARKLLFRKTPTSSPRPASVDLSGNILDNAVSPDFSDLQYMGHGSCLIPWSRDLHYRSPLASPVVETNSAWGVVDSQPILRGARLVEPLVMRTKGRAYSSPLPLPSLAFDIVPLAPADLFEEPPQPPPAYFEDRLPHELQLQILVSLVNLHAAEHAKRVAEGKWTAHKASASRNKWVGRDRGVRELFRLSRVSRTWRQLVFDGQLWAKLDLCSFPKLPPAVLVRLAQTAGGFVKGLDLSGHSALTSTTLIEVSQYLSARPTLPTALPHTNLTYINLQGCYALTTRSLHHILIRSPQLKKLCLRGQLAVTNATCEILAGYCPELVSLDLGRCRNLTEEGIRSVATAAVARGEYIPLKELRLSGLKGVNDDMMAALGRAAPFLEVLDLSYASVHNSAIEAFVSCTPEEAPKLNGIQLSSREAGRDPSDPTRYWRRVTRLRHLNLSSCVLLTDHACSHLAHAVPQLEFLELAGIGPELRDDGLVRLLGTTPRIRRLDLEDATEVTDKVLHALTPSAPPPSSASPAASPRTSAPVAPPEPGHALEHLVLSYANVESDALAELVRACGALRVLEADNTRMTGLVLREFVHAARRRGTPHARVVAVDCRAVGEHAVRELAALTRPRAGWRGWHARRLAFLDARDDEGLGVGQDECDPGRVVVKTFYSWQTVDAVKAAREKKRLSGARRGAHASESSTSSEGVSGAGRARWWSPGGRRSGPNTPLLDTAERGGEGCTIM